MNDESLHLVDKGIDASETDGALQRRRTARRVVIGGVAVAALVGGGLAVAQPWSGDDGDRADEPSATTTPPPAVADGATAGELPFVLLDDIPDGYLLQWASGPAGEAGGPWVDDLSGVQQSVLLVGAPGATFSDGPWVSISVQLLDRFERASFDPSSYLSGPDGPASTVRVGDARGALADNWWGDGSSLLFGPVNDGFAVSVSALGVSDDDLLRMAAEITLDERGDMADAVLGPAAAALGLELLAAYDETTWGLGGGPSVPLLSPGADSLSAAWAMVDGAGGQISLTVQHLPPGLDTGMLGGFFLAGAHDVQVGEWPGIAGDFEVFGGSDAAVVWMVDDSVVVVSGSLPPDELLDVAGSARVGDAAEWAELVDEANSNGGFVPEPDVPTWIIGAGDFDDGTTWVVEGAVDGQGGLLLCSASVSQFSSWSTCDSSQAVEGPTLRITGSFDVAAAAAVVAVVDPVDAGATLQCTTDAGDERTATVGAVHEDWPYLAAVVMLTETGSCTLVAPDGTVLATEEIGDIDLVTGGVGVATTVAAG